MMTQLTIETFLWVDLQRK